MWVLVASRVLLRFGISAAYPASMSLLRSESERTGRKNPSGVLAALSISNQVIAVVGPTLGGLLIGTGGWHLIFGINVPLSLVPCPGRTVAATRDATGQDGTRRCAGHAVVRRITDRVHVLPDEPGGRTLVSAGARPGCGLGVRASRTRHGPAVH
ncbi:MFS transporter [Streptomyces sp. ALI-76-A]|uniref:MFS transporter n=1 Tax=Streptomyces sp. ALI-76-A TaxID=3025736 RepID=UPI00256F2E09|nr:MFS transporter [Streptomyces sp. ALI-76-A]MDL5206462.1 MFS transporter [Streptomyces sp. ALI-76-A]